MDSPPPDLPDDIDALRAVAAAALARNADDAATIARQNLEIAKLKRQIYGPRSERVARLLDQMELELENLEASATEDEIAAGDQDPGDRRLHEAASVPSAVPGTPRASGWSCQAPPPAHAAVESG